MIVVKFDDVMSGHFKSKGSFPSDFSLDRSLHFTETPTSRSETDGVKYYQTNVLVCTVFSS